jgi:hypothetical protein
MKVTIEITEKEIKLFKEISERYIKLFYLTTKLIIWSIFQ